MDPFLQTITFIVTLLSHNRLTRSEALSELASELPVPQSQGQVAQQPAPATTPKPTDPDQRGIGCFLLALRQVTGFGANHKHAKQLLAIIKDVLPFTRYLLKNCEEATMSEPSQARKAIIFFLLLTFALSSIFYVILGGQGSTQSAGGLFTLLLMWCPGVAALIVRRGMKIKEPGVGWRPGQVRYLWLGYLIPIVYGLVAYSLIWISGIAPFQNGVDANMIGLVLVGSITGNLSSLGEELGWRGFLVPGLMKLTDFKGTALISGAIWALWHFPLLLSTDYNRSTPGLYSLLMFAILVIAMSFLYTWVRLRSNSIWPVVLLHTSHNVFILHVFDSLTTQTPLAPYFISETGVGLVVVILLINLIVWWMNRNKTAVQVGVPVEQLR
jgi:membrane protease YdiL (CAAX protease family)